MCNNELTRPIYGNLRNSSLKLETSLQFHQSDGSVVKLLEKFRGLGILFDRNISMTQQITEAKKKR